MKKLSFIIAISVVLSIVSACSKQTGQITIVRDCTGTYGRIGDNDWFICNYADLEDYADGTVLDVEFIQLQDCSASENPPTVCLMYHENLGKIRISGIN